MSVILVRHAERLDKLDERWFDKYNMEGKCIMKDNVENIYPCSLPVRRDIDDYKCDPPLTMRGKQDAKSLGVRIEQSNSNITSIYVSPMYRCIETAHMIAEGAGLHDIKLKVEPGLLEWAATNGRNVRPLLSHQELNIARFKICNDYKPSIVASDINVMETTEDYSHRTEKVFLHCLKDHEQTRSSGTMVLVAHQLTVLTLPVSLVESRTPYILELLLHASKLPYLGHVILITDCHKWHTKRMAFANKGDAERYEEVYTELNEWLSKIGCKYWDSVVYFLLNTIFTRFPSLLKRLSRDRSLCWERLAFESE